MVRVSRKYMTSSEAELIDKWILILLSVNNNEPIKGRIRFTKDFFLIAEKYLPRLYKISEFYPYHFGPYSTRFAQRVNQLRYNNFISAKLINRDWEYSITKEGIEKISSSLDIVLDELIRNIENIKQKNKNLSLKQILKELYLDYPNFAKRAIKRKEYLREKINLDELEKVDDGTGFIASFPSQEKEIELRGKAAKLFLKLLSE